MSHATTWRPAPRPGLVPLYPFGFGTALGRAFSALRGNPKVLLGFAVGVQTLASLVGGGVIGVVTVMAFSRLDTVPQYSDEFDAIMAGSVAFTIVVGIVVSLLLTALSVIVQGVVVAEVSRAVVGERASLRQLWATVRPAFWPLAGYFALQLAAVLLAMAVVALPLVLGAVSEQWGVMLIALPLGLALIPLWVWLGTKLYLVPSAIVLERIGPIRGIRRSWILTRGRFWATFGVMILISLIMGVASSVVSVPLQLVTSFLPAIVMPFGQDGADPGPAIVIGIVVAVLSFALQLLVSAISTIVTGTGGALMYIDARMRREGLDLRLQGYVEQRELGATALPDPWAYDPSFAPRPAFPPQQAFAPQPAFAPQGYAQPGHPQPGHPQPGYAQPGPWPQAPSGQQPSGRPPYPPYPPSPASPPSPQDGGS